MIGYLKGKVLAKNPDTLQATFLAHRVGYELHIAQPFFDLLLVGEKAEAWVHTHVREDTFALYGFRSESEKHFFRLLLTVSGLGPKSNLALLSEHGTEKLALYIRGQDATSISSAPGIGKKIAQKIILELQPKIEKLSWIALSSRTSRQTQPTVGEAVQPLREDLASALVNLGFTPGQVKPAVERVLDREESENPGFEKCLRLALKELNTRPVEGGSRG